MLDAPRPRTVQGGSRVEEKLGNGAFVGSAGKWYSIGGGGMLIVFVTRVKFLASG